MHQPYCVTSLEIGKPNWTVLSITLTPSLLKTKTKNPDGSGLSPYMIESLPFNIIPQICVYQDKNSIRSICILNLEHDQ